MNQELVNVPAARSWRDIPQPVKPRAMSRGGRWRQLRASARNVGIVVLVVVLAWGGWMALAALRQNSPRMPNAAKAVPVKAPELKTTRDGVLDNAWLARTLALPKGVSLMELDLEKLRARVLADGQVVTATLTRHFPDRLVVQITERFPIARIRVEQTTGVARDLLVARDGAVFAGNCFDPAMLETLPWLAGIALSPDGAGFRPLAGMGPVAQLLADAQFAAAHLYETWLSVSLARLESDHELEVTTKDGTVIVFNAAAGYFVQLAKLDYMAERLARVPGARARIDLTLGREVPVMIESPGNVETKSGAHFSAAALAPISPALTNSLSKTKREL